MKQAIRDVSVLSPASVVFPFAIAPAIVVTCFERPGFWVDGRTIEFITPHDIPHRRCVA
jgi:hypothetical protein